MEKEELANILALYIDTNDISLKNKIVDNKDMITENRSLLYRQGYRYWKLPLQRTMDILMGYKYLVSEKYFLSYYAFPEKTSLIFKNLFSNELISLVEFNYGIYYDITTYAKTFGGKEAQSVLKKYNNECELIRFDIESYHLDINSNIYGVIAHKKVFKYIGYPVKNLTCLSDDYYMLSDYEELINFKRYFKKLYDKKAKFVLEKLDFFPKEENIFKKNKIYDKKVIDNMMMVGPNGNKIVKLNLN